MGQEGIMFTIFETSKGNHILVEKTNRQMIYRGEFLDETSAVIEAEELGEKASQEFTKSGAWK